MQAIGPTEVKLLYTLQWILLFAAEECRDDLSEQSPPVKIEESKSTEKYLFSIPTITVGFLYNFIICLQWTGVTTYILYIQYQSIVGL